MIDIYANGESYPIPLRSDSPCMLTSLGLFEFVNMSHFMFRHIFKFNNHDNSNMVTGSPFGTEIRV